MRIAFWVTMKLLAGVGVVLALVGWGYYLVMSALDQQTFGALAGISVMFLSIPLMVVPCIALLFKRFR
jgi:uncharacterized membrane protein YhaH (DUF805 family)